MREAYYLKDSICLFHGDAREILPEMLAEGWKFDGVLTDPPYGIVKGAAFVRDGGETVADDAAETFNALVPERQWVPEAARLLREGGYFATFCDTRRVRVTEDALQGFYEGTDDPRIPLIQYDHNARLNLWRRFYLINQAPPPTPRPTFMSGVQECVIAWKGTTPNVKREWYGGGSTPNFWIGLPATRGQNSTHPAEKPLDAMVLLMNALCQPGGIVLDPFAGSGTTLKAAQLTGRAAVGIELEESRCEEIVRRLTQSVRSDPSQPVLF